MRTGHGLGMLSSHILHFNFSLVWIRKETYIECPAKEETQAKQVVTDGDGGESGAGPGQS